LVSLILSAAILCILGFFGVVSFAAFLSGLGSRFQAARQTQAMGTNAPAAASVEIIEWTMIDQMRSGSYVSARCKYALTNHTAETQRGELWLKGRDEHGFECFAEAVLAPDELWCVLPPHGEMKRITKVRIRESDSRRAKTATLSWRSYPF
jgi:hypothetical protein